MRLGAFPQDIKMNIFQYQNLQIIYNNSLKRIAIAKDEEYLSLTLAKFKLFLTLAKIDSDVNRIRVTQEGSEIDILNLYGNFMLTAHSWNYNSTITISKKIIDRLIINEDLIELQINDQKKLFIGKKSSDKNSSVVTEEPINSKTVSNYRKSIENVVKSANSDLFKQKLNLNQPKDDAKGDCIAQCTYSEPEFNMKEHPFNSIEENLMLP